MAFRQIFKVTLEETGASSTSEIADIIQELVANEFTVMSVEFVAEENDDDNVLSALDRFITKWFG